MRRTRWVTTLAVVTGLALVAGGCILEARYTGLPDGPEVVMVGTDLPAEAGPAIHAALDATSQVRIDVIDDATIADMQATADDVATTGPAVAVLAAGTTDVRRGLATDDSAAALDSLMAAFPEPVCTVSVNVTTHATSATYDNASAAALNAVIGGRATHLVNWNAITADPAMTLEPDHVAPSAAGNAALADAIATQVDACLHPTAAPLPVAGRRNFLGTGNVGPGAGTFREGFFLAISGACASKEQGDRFNTRSDANHNTSSPTGGGAFQHCIDSGAVANDEHRPDGYLYAVTVPEDRADNLNLEVLSRDGNCTTPGDSATQFVTGFRAYGPAPSPADAEPVSDSMFSTNLGWGCSWNTLTTLSQPRRGTYYIRVWTSGSPPSSSSDGSNQFGLRANPAGGPMEPCTADPTDTAAAFDPVCATVAGRADAGMYMSSPGSIADTAVVSTGPSAGAKLLQIDVWDPGEGSRALQVLDPTGAVTPFTWDVACWDPTQAPCPDNAPTGGWSGSSYSVVDGAYTFPHALDLLGSTTTCTAVGGQVCPWGTSLNPQPGPRRASSWKYSDRLVRLTVALPGDIAGAYGGATWWTLRTNGPPIGVTVTDRRTLSAQIVDP